MKLYRTKRPTERLNARYVRRKGAYRIAAHGRALYITTADLARAARRLGCVVALAATVALLLSTAQAPEPAPAAMTPAPLSSVQTSETIPTPPPTPEPTAPPSRYAGIELSAADVETLARLVWLEARGEPFEGQVAVVEVVLNRVLRPAWPDMVDEVVYQTGPIQFSPAARIPDATPGEEQYRAVETALTAAESITDADVVYFSTTGENERVFATIGGHIFCRE